MGNKLRSASLVRYRRQHVLQLLQQFVQLTLVSADLLETLTRQFLAFGTSNHEPKETFLGYLGYEWVAWGWLVLGAWVSRIWQTRPNTGIFGSLGGGIQWPHPSGTPLSQATAIHSITVMARALQTIPKLLLRHLAGRLSCWVEHLPGIV